MKMAKSLLESALRNAAPFIATLVTFGGISAVSQAVAPVPAGMVLIPGGTFEMGDHHGFVDPKHGGDEAPVHTVRLDAFYMGIHDVTTRQYCEFLNSTLDQQAIEVRQGGIYLKGRDDLLCETRTMSPYSRIGWDGARFAVLDAKENHPVVCIRWSGAAAYCNWLSAQQNLPFCYDPATWDCDLNKSGYRLPSEAEWEYAARGGQQNPYRNFPWGDEPDAMKANWPESRNPFRAGPEPWTTPVGFFNGELHKRVDFGWPGAQENFQTSDGANGYGLYDMAGNVWQFVNDWYGRDYYAFSPVDNPPGPDRGSLMPDGKSYRGMRGGNWYNGEYGHSRVSNRNPSYWRGPQDPDHPYYHIGFRVVLPVNAESRTFVKPTPVQNTERANSAPRERRSRDTSVPPRPDTVRPVRGSAFVLRSPEVTDEGVLPSEFTGDGAAATLPLEWNGAPEGTQSYAVIMHHVAPDQTKWYWILYDIPASVQSLPKNVAGIGRLGNNSIDGRAEYAPPHSKGPGPKTYVYTLYALSAPPQLNVPPEQVNRNVLLAAMKDLVLGSAELSVVYTRQNLGGGQGGKPRSERPGDRPPPHGWRDLWGWWSREPPPPDFKRQSGREQPGRQEDSQAIGENRTPASQNADQTVGLFLNTPKTLDGYTLFAPKHNTMTYLISNGGQVVHEWTKSRYEPGQTVYLLENGHLLRCCFTHARGFTRGGEGGRIEEYDWNDSLVWEFDYSNDIHMLHHDIRLLPNGNILALAVEKKTRDECIAAGFDPRMLRDEELCPDYVIEIQPTPPSGGNIVWEWHVWDHLVQDNDPAKANYGDVSAHPERIDVDCNGRPTPSFWNHMNSIDYNPELDQILLSVRGCNEVWVIDHGTTSEEAKRHTGGRAGKGGDLLYRWGNPAAYRTGDGSDRQLFEQHDAQWIAQGCPGAGNILAFNNGLERGYSSVEEIVPPVDSQGRYTLAAGTPCGPARPVWHYEAANPTDFFSSEISGAQRLPNGNTLVCEGIHGTFFEVSPEGETVWRYVNPVIGLGPLAQGERSPKDHRDHDMNAVFKVHRYAVDYPAFAGKDLTPKGVLERPASERRSQEELEALPGAHGPAGPGKEPGRRGGDERRPPPRNGNQPSEQRGPEGMSPETIRSLGYL